MAGCRRPGERLLEQGAAGGTRELAEVLRVERGFAERRSKVAALQTALDGDAPERSAAPAASPGAICSRIAAAAPTRRTDSIRPAAKAVLDGSSSSL